MLTVKQGCGRWGGNKPTPVRQARSRRGPREHQAAGGFMETSPCAWRWLSTSTTSSGQGERHCPVALGPDVLGSPRPLCSTGGGMLGPKSPQLQQGSARCARGTGGGRAGSREGRRNAWERHPKGAPERAALPANEVGACERARAENPRRAHQAPCLR